MSREKFVEDLQTVYDELQRRQKELNEYYKLLDGPHPEAQKMVDTFLTRLELQDTKENVMAAKIGQDSCQIAGTLYRRAGGHSYASAYLGRDDMG